jgi:crotonobetainyl-CoA:carnitine CoA-transferase CaiB-like acyl-CoA transferase
MTAVMDGVRILEVAEHTFVPAASAVLADWGAEVIKIEHVERGDAMRGLGSTGVADIPADVHPLLEHSNRGKRSVALDLTTADGIDILYRLAATADVFLTNKLPGVRKKLHIELDQIRAANPRIIYASGTGQGERGPDADKGSYDHLAFWCRAGASLGSTKAEYGAPVGPPGPGFGDSIGAMIIAGGIMGALYHRERTGEATTVDVSLLGTGMWAMGQATSMSLLTGRPWGPPPGGTTRMNPISATYETKDHRFIALTCLQAGKYWPHVCRAADVPELIDDERFADHVSLLTNGSVAYGLLKQKFAEHTLAEWRDKLADFIGQWAVVQDTIEAANDPQSVANGYIQDCQTESGVPFKLVAAPVQFGGEAAQPQRAPLFNEHGDAVLAELGLDWDTVVDLKVRGVVA